MKLIEAMKKIKDLQVKAADLREKIGVYHADLDFETPMYPDQKAKVSEWLQGHSDLLKEIMRLGIAIQRTNLATPITIELGPKTVTKTIAEWVLRRGTKQRPGLAASDLAAWAKLNDKGLREGNVERSDKSVQPVKIRRHYDPQERDTKISLFKSEPSTIDAALEVANAVTDLIE